MHTITLHSPNLAMASSFCSFVEEMRAAGETIWPVATKSAEETETGFVARLLQMELAPPDGLVPESHYWGWDGKQVVGRIALRHFLNENLRKFGGHIGYEVRPSSRRKGVATEMLRLLLKTPRVREIGRVLLTCAPTNIPSVKTILANGGIFEKTAYVEKWQRDTSYYWITIADLRESGV